MANIFEGKLIRLRAVEPSRKLHEALGFTLEGQLRRMIYTGGTFHDALIYGITREEFEEKQLKVKGEKVKV